MLPDCHSHVFPLLGHCYCHVSISFLPPRGTVVDTCHTHPPPPTPHPPPPHLPPTPAFPPAAVGIGHRRWAGGTHPPARATTSRKNQFLLDTGRLPYCGRVSKTNMVSCKQTVNTPYKAVVIYHFSPPPHPPTYFPNCGCNSPAGGRSLPF